MAPPPMRNGTVDVPPQRLTWNLDKGFTLVPANVTAGHISLTGATDPSHGRDLLRFTGEATTAPLWLSNFTVHLIFETATPWTDAQGGVEFWFGYDIPDDAEAAPSFPVNGGLDVGLQQAGTRFDVRINDTALSPGGVGLPAGVRPIFLVAVRGTQSAAAPLLLDVGGDKNSHVHPVVAPWNRTAAALVAGPQASGTLVPAMLGAGPGASPAIALALPDSASGFVAVVRANGTNGAPVDLDVVVLDAAGLFVAQSNSPYEREAIRFYAANLNATGRSLSLQVVDGSTTPAQYWLQVFYLEPAVVP